MWITRLCILYFFNVHHFLLYCLPCIISNSFILRARQEQEKVNGLGTRLVLVHDIIYTYHTAGNFCRCKFSYELSYYIFCTAQDSDVERIAVEIFV